MPRERSVLEVLILRNGCAIKRDAVGEDLRARRSVNADAIEIYVYRLAEKLENTGVAIVTLRGLGYLLEAKATGDEARADASAGGGVTIRPNLRTQVALWLLLPLLGLLALDSWLTYQRAMSAAHVAFDRTLSSSLKSIRRRAAQRRRDRGRPAVSRARDVRVRGRRQDLLPDPRRSRPHDHRLPGPRCRRARRAVRHAVLRRRVSRRAVADGRAGCPSTTCRARRRASCG
jgi:hypothetical protein